MTTCHKGKKPMKQFNGSPKSGYSCKPQQNCPRCETVGHDVKNCFYKFFNKRSSNKTHPKKPFQRGKPQWEQKKKWKQQSNVIEAEDSPDEEYMLLVHTSEDGSQSTYIWYVDLGAPKHTTGQKKCFLTLKPHHGTITLGDDTTYDIKGIGDISLKFCIHSCRLTNVLCTCQNLPKIFFLLINFLIITLALNLI